MKRRPFHSASPYIRSRVVRARSSTIACRRPTIRLKSVLLPTFGRPTIATTGMPARARDDIERPSGRAGRWRGAFVVDERGQRRCSAGGGCSSGEGFVREVLGALRDL